MMKLAAVFFGGGIGAVSRHGLNGVCARLFPAFGPAGTLVANVVGAFCIGLLFALFATKNPRVELWQALLMTGYLGGLTTFSTFSLQTVEYLEGRHYGLAFLNIAANVALSLTATGLAIFLVRKAGWTLA